MEAYHGFKQYCTCKTLATFKCLCQGIDQYFCSPCAVNHLQDDVLHKNLLNSNPPYIPESKSILINYLFKSLRNLEQSKENLLKETQKIISKFQMQESSILAQINKISDSITSMIKRLLSSPRAIKEANIVRSIALNSHSLSIELEKWKLFSVDISTEELENLVSSWVRCKDFTDIFFNNEIILNEKLLSNMFAKDNAIEEQKINSKNRHFSSDFDSKKKIEHYENQGNNNFFTVSVDYDSNFSKNMNLKISNEKPVKKLAEFELAYDMPSERSKSYAFESIEPSLYCSKKHKLAWSYTVLLEYSLKKRFTNIECALCRKVSMKPCWHCSNCCYDICEDCGTKKGVLSPKLTCEKNHDLMWKCTVASKYEKLYKNSFWSCNSCSLRSTKPVWHCSYCNFNLCQKCASKNSVISIELKNTCLLKHKLINKQCFGETQCSNCSNLISNFGNSCEVCNYNTCEKCNELQNLDIAQDNVISCTKGHLLRWDIVNSKMCVVCRQNVNSKAFSCKACSFYICFECADYLEEIRRNNIIRKDKNQHELSITPVDLSTFREKIFYCYACNIQFNSNCIAFSCTLCNFFFCINCFRKGCKTSTFGMFFGKLFGKV
ncbi:hypothetical protein SteCoe_33965 [Stentor coeruleus]|uniref:ZZ-type domain-containing protein n=1 Tax=Stentor coeruleus TaxID=5963 RepID=A0A1R2AVS0_9CILI|nr:hypothetical protein SteCoe_33965 [Stentor coeruleus]